MAVILGRTEVRLDMTEFQEAVRTVHENTRKTLPEIINRGALVTLIGGAGVQGAMKRTPKAARDAILGVPEKLVAGFVMNKHKGQKLDKATIKALVRKEYQRRVAAIGYTANVGWNKAVIDLGGTGLRSHTAGKGYAELGYGVPSDEGQWPLFVAEMINAAPAAEMIGEEPLQAALDDTAEDMVDHVTQGMQSICDAAGSR